MSARREDRLQKLACALEGRSVLHLKDAAALLGVSEMTVRRDVDSSEGGLRRLGGYVVGKVGADYRLEREETENGGQKRAACAGAAPQIGPLDTVFIDCGTTTPFLAEALPSDFKGTIVAYALNVAERVLRHPAARLILLGGVYHSSSSSFFSEEALSYLGRVGVNVAFFSAGGVHADIGVSCSNFHEVAVKQAVLRHAQRKILLVDASKFGAVKPAVFGALEDFDAVASEYGLCSPRHVFSLLPQASSRPSAAPEAGGGGTA